MSSFITSFWSSLGRGARVAVLGGATLAIALIIWASFLALQVPYGVLFTDLAEGDAAAIVEQLRKDKIQYRLSDAGTTISVPAKQVHDVRLELMTRDVPLSGGVGFEIFDQQGFGTTEHSQRVSYQRALQGELARTIGTLNQVKQVRVHLVMPESSLFTRDRQQASAAVAITMKPGATLDRQQIVGVQRLVAAAVAGLDAGRVVVTDQRGVVLSTGDSAGVSAGAADARLQVKREIEEYVTHKVARLLDSAFGPGRALVSVDAVLNFDATKTTVQDLLPAGGNGGEGLVVRRRQVTSPNNNDEPLWTSTAENAPAHRSAGSSVDVEYEHGRRVEEVIAAPGAITRLSVGVVVPDQVTEEKRHQILELVKMAAGINEARGDAITVQPLSQVEPATADEATQAAEEPEATHEPSAAARPQFDSWTLVVIGGLLLLAVVAVVANSHGSKRQPLSPQDRQRVLAAIQQALAQDAPISRERTRS